MSVSLNWVVKGTSGVGNLDVTLPWRLAMPRALAARKALKLNLKRKETIESIRIWEEEQVIITKLQILNSAIV